MIFTVFLFKTGTMWLGKNMAEFSKTCYILPVDNSSKFEFVKQKIKMNGLKW